jgi:ubiquinone/menaquinone biosynthesis C-methylase UbiE
MEQKEVWNNLAEPWKKYRNRMPEEIEKFLNNHDGLILDIGCGSGRNIIDGKNIIGIDFSEKMVRFARKAFKKNMFVVCDMKKLPFKEGAFDSAMCVSSLQCVEDGRKDAIKEMFRVMKSGSEAIVTVWNREQPRFSKKEDYVPWEHNGKKYMRYYYLFSKDELEKLLKTTGFVIIDIFGSARKVFNLFPRNIIAIVQKRG